MVRQLQAELLIEAETELGECPLWCVVDRRLAFLDIDRRELLRLDPGSPEELERTHLTSRVSATAESRSGQWIAATETGFGWLDPFTGTVSELISVTDPTSARMNDGTVDPYGRFWAGSASLDRTRRNGSLFMIDADLDVHVMLKSVGMSNGLGWLNGNVLLHVDTLSGTVTAYDVIERDAGTALENARPLIQIPTSHGLPDGLAVDESGAFWLAIWGAGEVRRYTPDGELDTVVTTGAVNVTSCAFGGVDLDMLYITSARQGLTIPGRTDGAVFHVSPKVRGIESNRFEFLNAHASTSHAQGERP